MKKTIITISIAVIVVGSILTYIYHDNLCKVVGCDSPKKSDNTSVASCNSCGKHSCDKTCTSNPSSDTVGKKIFSSCSLSSEQSEERKKQLEATIFKKVKSVEEMKDGYEFIFKEPAEFSTQLLDFVNFEKGCCGSFTFGLIFEPDGTSHLQMYGSPEIKEELKTGFKDMGLIK